MTANRRILQALTADPWAIEPSWLPILASIAQREPRDVDGAAEWAKRDYRMMAGPAAQPLGKSTRSYVVDGVAMIPVMGPIFPRANLVTEMSGATSLAMLSADLSAALETNWVKSILFMIDSPGGAVSGLAAFVNEVFAASKQKATSSYVIGNAASAAYWIAAATTSISMDRTALIGSIGVVAAVQKQVAPNSEGFIDIEIVSSNAPNKRLDPESEDGQAQIRTVLDGLEAEFISDVARGRDVTPAKVRKDFGRGGVVLGKAAVAAGMADRIETKAAAIASARNAGKFKAITGRDMGARLSTDEQEAINQRRMAQLRRS